MRFKSIYIKGFKSFPKETLINFNEKVTGIVGPNGSGKSNVLDAIRWVLGEQKPSELRLDNMSDVLFNGTKNRKKSAVAEVVLTFDNTKNIIPTEYTTVAVSRTLYRTGESEYRLNDEACRLKDIRTLFMDTGIGPDSYAIIALNMVEDILADKNGSRRFMFEQASGISKFKKRKKETISKLKLTKEDLNRVEDLLFEIETNLKDLKKQAKRAEKYIKVREQYKDKSIKLQLSKYDSFVDSYKTVKNNISNELDNFRQIEILVRTKESDLEKGKKDILESEKNLSEFQKKINEHLDQIRKIENDKNLTKQKLEYDESRSEDIEKSQIERKKYIARYDEDILSLKDRIEKEKEKLAENQSIFENYNKKLLEIRKKYDELKGVLDEANLKRKRKEENRFQLVKEKAIVQNNIDNYQNNISRKNQQLVSLKKENEQVESSFKTLEAEKKTLEEKLKYLSEEKDKKTVLLQKTIDESEDIKSHLNDTSRKLDAKRNEHKLLKSMVDNLEGFPESIRFLNKKWNGKVPLLTDIIAPPEEYKVAIESYLEPFLNFFVVEDEFEAREAISTLRKTQKGKVNFFVLNRLQKSNKKVDKLKDFTAVLDIIEYDDKYHDLLYSLLGRVYVSLVDMDEVYSGDELNKYAIIDKSGSFISDGAIISGGSLGLFEGNKLGRKSNLKKLKSLINNLESKQEELEVQLKDKKEIISQLKSSTIDNEINKINAKIGNINKEFLQANFSRENYLKNKNSLQKEIESHALEIEKLNSNLETIEVGLKDIDKDLNLIVSSLEDKSSTADNLTQELSKASSNSNNAQIDLIKQQNLLSTLENNLSNKKEDKDSLKKKYEAAASNQKTLVLEIEKSKKNIVQFDQQLIDKYKQKSSFDVDLGQFEKDFFENRSIVTELENELAKKKQLMNKSQYLINELREKKLDLDFNKQTINERLKIEFNIEIKDVLDYEREETSEDELQANVDKLKKTLDNYGEVNTLAVEAYNEMNKRYENIQKQREDVLSAEKSLKKTISEIEKTATELFLKAFEDIRGHFKSVFESLFKMGDTSDLYLEEPDNPLESKIFIVAKPKGKRPRSLNQLSGGEKTLTAIALLFALYLHKPAPFCIFDEVDAPLDDANIYKFNNIIREFSENSQFIVVTHNKATMSAVDVLYGVFMQELGVSEVAQVDFRNYEELSIS